MFNLEMSVKAAAEAQVRCPCMEACPPCNKGCPCDPKGLDQGFFFSVLGAGLFMLLSLAILGRRIWRSFSGRERSSFPPRWENG